MKCALLLFLTCAACFAKEPVPTITPKLTDGAFTTLTAPESIGHTIGMTTTIVFQHGKGWVSIDGDTGKITFKDCKPEGSGVAFWRAVMKAHPEIKKAFSDCPCCGK